MANLKRSYSAVLGVGVALAIILTCAGVVGMGLISFFRDKRTEAQADARLREAYRADLDQSRLALQPKPRITGTVIAVDDSRESNPAQEEDEALYRTFRESTIWTPRERWAGPPTGADFLIWIRWKKTDAEQYKLQREGKLVKRDVEAEVFVCDRKRKELIATWRYKGYVERIDGKSRRKGSAYILKMPEADLQRWIDGILQ